MPAEEAPSWTTASLVSRTMPTASPATVAASLAPRAISEMDAAIWSEPLARLSTLADTCSAAVEARALSSAAS